MSLCNAFTVDVEDYYQVSAFESIVSRERWGDYESRVVDNTRRLLELLDEFDVHATFFVLGWVADRFPQLVREIDSLGHEVGSHSYWHRLVYRQTRDEFRADLIHSRQVIEDAIGCRVKTYRAPSFSITSESLWALDILAEEGFEIDSSIFPIYHDRYGIPDAPTTLHHRVTDHGDIWEFPPPVLRVAGMNLPVGGGGYFRLYPLACTLRWLTSFNRKMDSPFVFYVHPWELDPDQPRLPVESRLTRIRHYLNLSKTERRLRRMLGEIEFGTVGEAVAAQQAAQHSESGAAPVRP